ncbi:hypothetical protein CEUSTIGMA_g3551.t1 [Chlamydomonas eustigma]|uniref:WW domain-containing protein n=1 Tax=Chlamydomonas eustigma TaxID=1157962 RepID=A0A250WZ39_9CHLO|nr:hypothetical protein CEUSTIGMA_g3551.t1 [Chlamydomonas eustigma]|eukprot:GAX76108.1 hypothetical protein CEUSTIGMA_g3551.t1 [Chlamydomonas eustigma]
MPQNVEVESIPPLSTTGHSLKQGSTVASVGQPHYGMSQGAAAPLIQGFFMLLNMLVTSRLALIERMWVCVCESASAELESTSSIQPPSYSDVRCALSESQQDVETIQDEVRRLQELLKETTDALQAQQQLHQQVPHLCNTITGDASGHVTQLDQLPLTSAEGMVPNMQMHCDGGVITPSDPGHGSVGIDPLSDPGHDSVGIDPLSDPGLGNGERAPSSGHHSDGTTPSSPDHKSGGSESSGPGLDSGETAPSSEPGHDSVETAPSSEPGPVRDDHEANSSEYYKDGMSSTITADMTAIPITSTLPQTAHLNMLSPFYLPAQAPSHGSRAQLYSSSFVSRSADKLATAVAVATTPGVQRHVEIEVQSNLSNSEPSILTEKDSVNLNNWEHLAFTELQANVTKSLSQALQMIEDINSDGPQLEDITFASFDPAHLVKLHNFNDGPSEEDIKNYARYLGMDPEADSDLLYIAERACTAPVPDGWTVQLDDEGVEYFHSTIQNTSTYHHPRDEFYKKMYCDIKARKNLDTLLTPIQRASMGLSRSSISPLN